MSFAISEKFAESEERLRLALDATTDAIWDWDVKTGDVYFSPRYYTMLGYEPDEFPPTFDSWEKMLHPDDFKKTTEAVNNYLNSDLSLYDIEFRMKKKSGGWKWIQGRGKVVERDKDNTPVRMVGTHVDINNHKELEEELQQTQMYFTDFLNASSEGVSYWKVPEGFKIDLPIEEQVEMMYHSVCLDANKVTIDSYGFIEKNEIVGKKYIEIVAKKTADQFFTDFIKNNYRISDYETWEVRLDGSTEYALENLFGIFENGMLKSVWSSSKKITEKKIVEEALKESELKYRTLVDQTPSVSWITSREGKTTFISSNVESIYGFSPEEIYSNEELWIGRIHHDDINKVMERFGLLFSENKNYDIEYRIKRKDGKWIWLHDTASILSDEDDIPFAQGTFIEVTERKNAQLELNKLQEYLSNIIDSMPSVIIGVDSELKITQWNKAAEARFKIPFKDTNGKLFTEILPLYSNIKDNIMEAIQNKKLLKVEKFIQQIDDVTRYFDITIFSLAAASSEGVVIRIDDITERVQIEEMMIQTEKMMSVGGLAAGMAHEINNPLAGIMQSSQVIKDRINPKMLKNIEVASESGTDMDSLYEYMEKRKIIKFVDNIVESGKRASQIVQDMLAFSRKSESAVSSYDLREIMDKTLELAANDFDLKRNQDFRQIEIIKEYDENIPQVQCESNKIQQVILNLLKNGAQAMEVNKNTEKSSSFYCRVKEDGKYVNIEIEDNGPGMPEAVSKRIFEPFYTTKNVGEGTGLGLSVSYFIITENHNGKMFVKSQEGKGTIFVIQLPI